MKFWQKLKSLFCRKKKIENKEKTEKHQDK